MVGLVIGEMVGSGSIYPGLLMSDNSTDGWIGDKEIPGPEADGGVRSHLSWSTDVRQLNRWLDW